MELPFRLFCHFLPPYRLSIHFQHYMLVPYIHNLSQISALVNLFRRGFGVGDPVGTRRKDTPYRIMYLNCLGFGRCLK